MPSESRNPVCKSKCVTLLLDSRVRGNDNKRTFVVQPLKVQSSLMLAQLMKQGSTCRRPAEARIRACGASVLSI